MHPAEATDQLWNVLSAERAQESERDGTAGRRLEVRELAAAIVDFGERALDPRQEELARPGQADRAARPPEQLHAEIGLQPRQRAAQGRLAGAELLGRAGNVLQAARDAEAFEQVPVGSIHAPAVSLLNLCTLDIYLT
jgi:hypothetical protein